MSAIRRYGRSLSVRKRKEGVRLISHVVVEGHTTIGAGCVVYPFCTVGMAPQDLKYQGEPTETVIGPRTQLREHCTIHPGTVTGTGVTRVGADCLLMAVVHVSVQGDLVDYLSTADSGNVMHRRFCPRCGTALLSASEARPDLLIVRAGALDEREGLQAGHDDLDGRGARLGVL